MNSDRLKIGSYGTRGKKAGLTRKRKSYDYGMEVSIAAA